MSNMTNTTNQVITNRQGKTLSIAVSGPQDAPAIIFSNSLGTDKGMWAPQIDAFSKEYQVISYDTRGHGGSEVIEDTTIENLGEDVIDILDALTIDKAHFCGISMGGITALWLAIHHPERFYTITVANSAAKIGNTEAWEERAKAVAKDGLDDIVATTHTRWFSEGFNYQNDTLAQSTIDSLRNTFPLGYAQSCLALAHADVRDQLADITVPTLIIAGTLDPVTTVADGEAMQAKIPNCELYEIEASHLSNIEQPADFIHALATFIADHPS